MIPDATNRPTDGLDRRGKNLLVFRIDALHSHHMRAISAQTEEAGKSHLGDGTSSSASLSLFHDFAIPISQYDENVSRDWSSCESDIR